MLPWLRLRRRPLYRHVVTAPLVPQFGILHENTEGGEGAENEAVFAIEESVAEDVHPEETPQRSKREIGPCGLFTGFVKVIGRPGGVTAEFFEIIF